MSWRFTFIRYEDILGAMGRKCRDKEMTSERTMMDHTTGDMEKAGGGLIMVMVDEDSVTKRSPRDDVSRVRLEI